MIDRTKWAELTETQRIPKLMARMHLYPLGYLLLFPMMDDIIFFAVLGVACWYQAKLLYRFGRFRDTLPAVLCVVYFILFFIPGSLPLHPLFSIFLIQNVAMGIGKSSEFAGLHTNSWRLVYLSTTLLYNAAFWLGWILGPKKGASGPSTDEHTAET